MMARTLLPLLLLAAAGPVLAASDVSISMAATEACGPKPEDPSNCAPVFGCFASEGVWFVGEARGWSEGSVTVRASSGLICEGSFDYRQMIDMGRTVITCSDGDEIPMSFFNRGGDSGVVTGTGVSENGRRVQMWAGVNAPAFLRDRTGGDVAEVRCGETRLILN